MRICGIELKANNTVFSLVDVNNTHTHYMDIKEKKVALADDENIEELQNYVAFLKNLIQKYDIEYIAIKKRAKKGTFAGGAVTFKLEGLIQLNGLCEVKLISAQALSKFEKKGAIEFPQNLNKYQEQAYLSALYLYKELVAS